MMSCSPATVRTWNSPGLLNALSRPTQFQCREKIRSRSSAKICGDVYRSRGIVCAP